MNIYGNTDPTMGLFREFGDKATRAGRRSVVKEAQKFAEEMGLDLKLQHPDPTDQTTEGDRIETPKMGDWIKTEVQIKATVTKRSKEINGGVN